MTVIDNYNFSCLSRSACGRSLSFLFCGFLWLPADQNRGKHKGEKCPQNYGEPKSARQGMIRNLLLVVRTVDPGSRMYIQRQSPTREVTRCVLPEMGGINTDTSAEGENRGDYSPRN